MTIRSHISAVIFPVRPYAWAETDDNGRTFYQGVTISPFLNITNSLNISVELRVITSGFSGERLPNGTYVGQQQLIYDNEVDVAIGPFFRSPITALELEPGFPHLFSRFAILSGCRTLYTTEVATAPFDLFVSMCILSFVASIPLLFLITSRRGWPSMRISLLESFTLSLSVFLQDPIDTRRFISTPSRLTLATWSFGAFIIFQIVSGVLRSNVAVKNPVRKIDTLQQILDDPQIMPIARFGTPTMGALEEIRGEQVTRIIERMREMGSLLPPERIYNDETLNKILDTKAVFLQEPASMLVDIPPLCDRYKGYFHLNEKDYVQAEIVWYYSRGLDIPTRRAISERTLWTFDAGLRWVRERDLTPVPPKCFTFAVHRGILGDDDGESFSMEHLLPFFFILLLGNAAGFVGLLVELGVHRCSRHSMQDTG